jgi:gliding motility-associated-like protein
MTNYDWIVSAGGIISTGAETNSATVKWITLGWQTLSINYIDKNGCTAAAATENKMRVINPPLTKTEGISPNGDGINDLLIFKGLENYPGSKLVIFTRSGEKVYENNNYLNDWDGKFVNKISNSRITLLSGTYYYILELGGTKRTLKGFIYVGY